MDNAASEFLAEVDAFLARSGMTATAFGRAAVHDPSFVPDMREGRAPSLRMVQRVRDFIRNYEESPPTSPSDDTDNSATERVA